ncbi:hypothetical protein JIX56_42310 [Streptomyces sp. CA-210063]|uniref:hypothetical protein n=1 Tax=Streptomyces sp. CA-210063 TaxID=2801029 RepID=UPI00214AE75C|nr:hypothetical protein [Streptomyces sp. CA-210063]UUU35938.1 hypothetical protein JIX56_42310 [Streptomyces sp. CA-210063]
MLTHIANGDSRLSFWSRVREFAVPPSMIETATVRRAVGDWAGACAAAGIDIDLDMRSVAHGHGHELAAQVRADLRYLAPDLLRWHMPRIAPDGLLRPGLTLSLARYDVAGRAGPYPVHLVARTPPAWADAGQRIGLALWDGSRSEAAARGHPHPRPSRRYRLDLHRHLWDARRAGELRVRAGADASAADGPSPPGPSLVDSDVPGTDVWGTLAAERGCAVERWADEAAVVLRAEGRSTGTVLVRCGARRRLMLDVGSGPGADADGRSLNGNGNEPPALRIAVASGDDGVGASLPVLPDAATWVLPDLELIRAGAIDVERLHPLVASALVPGHVPSGPSGAPDRAGRPRIVECRGERHRIGLVDGVLVPLDHDPAEIRREELLVELTGTPLPCLQAIDEAHRRPDCLSGVRERLDHGDIAGALAVVEGLLGPEAVLRDGALRDELEAAARRRIAYGLYRAGLADPGPGRVRSDVGRRRPRHRRPRVATFY